MATKLKESAKQDNEVKLTLKAEEVKTNINNHFYLHFGFNAPKMNEASISKYYSTIETLNNHRNGFRGAN